MSEHINRDDIFLNKKKKIQNLITGGQSQRRFTDKVKSSSNKVFSTTLKQGIFYHKQGKTWQGEIYHKQGEIYHMILTRWNLPQTRWNVRSPDVSRFMVEAFW